MPQPHTFPWLARALLLVVLATLAPTFLSAQARPETLRGRVTTDSGAPVPAARVTVTMGGADRQVQTTATDTAGRWAVTFAAGAGDYLVHVAAPGRAAFRKRVTRAPESAGPVLVVDVVLQPIVQRLATVQVEAKKPKPDRRGGGFGPTGPGTGAAERDVEGVHGLVPPELAGDLGALAGTTPGTIATGRGVSALGLGAGQTNVTLGGLAFSGADLPRDARTNVKVTTSTFDPARGWFGGAQVAVELAPGSPFTSRRSHLTLDAPALQATDRIGARLGQQVTNLQASAGGDGGLFDDRWTYNVGGQLSRRTQDAPSLLDAAPDALQAAGVAPDSAARLLVLAADAGIPVGVGGAANARVTDQMSFIARVDRPSFDMKTFEPVRRTYGVTTYGKLGRSDAVGVTPTATLARGGESRSGSAGVQALYSAYIGKNSWLVEGRTGLSGTDERREPYLAIPGAQVLVGSLAGTGGAAGAGDATAPALLPLAVGGNGLLESRRRGWTWETQGELRFFPPRKARHRVTVTADARLDGVREDPAADRYGSYSYQSLADLEAGRPASYTRTLSAPAREAAVWNAFAALGDYWRVSERLQLLYGARVEGNAYATRPAANPALNAALGVRTTEVPNSFGVSPRLGFTWVGRGKQRNGYGVSQLGSFGFRSGSVLRGGVGEFRNLLGPDLVANATAATGLAGASQRLLCVGPAVPAASWDAWASGTAPLPTACAAGANGALTDAAPSVLAFAPGYTAPRSWRGNLAWSASRWKMAYGLEGVYSLNLNQPGTVDVNFAGVSQFTLAGENRPVFVPASAIVPATGALSPAESRRAVAFGRVALQRSDLRSVSRQLTLTLAPAEPNFGRWVASGAYTLSSVRAQAYGFDGGTVGDPRLREWGRGDLDVRHQFLLQGGYSRKGLSATLFGRIASGQPFTPLVGGDVNGDGYVNDRAFVFNPARADDPALAAGLQALGATAPAAVRDCLGRAAGGTAARNGCEGPWTATVNARFAATGTLLRLGRRVNVALNLANPLGGLDQLVHGRRLRGWGAPAFPDPVLYQVRGFDPMARRYRYEVNPRFGDTRPSATAFRAPFRVTLDVSLDIGRPIGEQQLDKWLRPGRGGAPGPRLTVEELKKRYARNVPDPYRNILQESDSLLLTRTQVDTLERAQARYQARVDSVWTGLATHLAALGDRYDAADALARQESAVDEVWELSRLDVQATLPAVLTPVQRRLLPWPASMLVTAREKVKVRMFMAGP